MLGLCMNSKHSDLKEMRAYLPKNFSEVQKCLFYSVGSVHDENQIRLAYKQYLVKWHPYPIPAKTAQVVKDVVHPFPGVLFY